MVMVLLASALAAPRLVHLKDGSVIECQSVAKKGGQVIVVVNRDTVVELAADEVDLKRTFPVSRKKAVKTAKKAVADPDNAPAVEAGQAAAPVASVPQPAAMPAPGAPSPRNSPPVAETEPQPAPPQPVEAKPGPSPEPPQAIPTPQPPIPPVPPAIAMIGSMFGTSFVIGMILVVLVLLVSFWKIYEKAGEPGWASLIPIYNLFVLVKIAGKPWWWFLLMFVPVVGIIISILVYIALAARFGKGVLYGLGLLFLGFIFIPMLAFDKSVYQG